MPDQTYLAALDVGGTKAIGVIFDTSGHILAKTRERGGTPLEYGEDECKHRFTDLICRLIDKAGVSVSALYISLATIEDFGPEIENWFRTHIPVPSIRLEADGPCLISAVLGHNDGVSMICGTGSSLYVRTGDHYHRCGGWGHLIDSCGSGYVLARRAIKAVLRAHDERGEETLLTELVNAQCGRPIWEDYVHMYKEGRPYIASYAHCLFEARNAGDVVARRIFNVCASDLADMVWTTRKKLGKPFTIILNGGIFTHYPEYARTVEALSPTDVTFVRSDVPPIYGCAVEAMHDVGLSCDAHFKERFMRELA